MAKIKLQGHASGTGILTVTAPNTSTDRTITLPDATGTLLNSDGNGSSLTGLPNGSQLDHSGTKRLDTNGAGIGIYSSTPALSWKEQDGTTKMDINFGANATDTAEWNVHPAKDIRFRNNSTTTLTLKSDGRGLSSFTAKSWCNVQMSSAAFNDQHNHDALTDISAGTFSLSFTVNMSGTAYCVVSSNPESYISGYTNLATDSFRGYNYDTNGTKVDVSQVCFAVFEN